MSVFLAFAVFFSRIRYVVFYLTHLTNGLDTYSYFSHKAKQKYRISHVALWLKWFVGLRRSNIFTEQRVHHVLGD